MEHLTTGYLFRTRNQEIIFSFPLMAVHPQRLYKIFIGLVIVLTLTGVGLRLYHITRNEFVFYDEGFYLNHNRLLGEVLRERYPKSFPEFTEAFNAFLDICLASGKTLWFAVADVRIFFGRVYDWYFSRLWAALFGIATLFLTYRFSQRFCRDQRTAWLALGVLAVLPSHVFYSRVGLQEALSTLLVLAGFYFYLFPREFGRRTFWAGLFFGAAFFSNYRLIMAPILVGFGELWESLTRRQRPSFRKYLWFALTFFSCVFFIGNKNNGQNTTIVFAWMFHQAQMAEGQFDWVNFFSYPYYIFRLDNAIFGLFLFGNIYFAVQKKWGVLFPFLISCLQMLLFSFAGDKGARYLCVVMPFMALAAAQLIVFLWDEAQRFRRELVLAVFLMAVLMTYKSIAMARIRSDYQPATQYLLSLDRKGKFLTTQPYVQNLYVANKKQVLDCPHTFEALMGEYEKGARYLVVDPQAYISWTDKDIRFNPKLVGYLGFVVNNVRPIKAFPHFNYLMMERFVFEHSTNLRQSVKFLALARKNNWGTLRIYEVPQAVNMTLKSISRYYHDRLR